jgi:hypothetical protein
VLFLCIAISLAYWLKNTDQVESNWAMDTLTNADNADLQNRINSKLFDNSMVDLAGVGADIDSLQDQSAMDAKLAGLTRNVTTEKVPTAQQLENFYQQNKQSYREPSTLWLWVATFSTANYGGQVFDKAQQALNNADNSKPQSDLFDRYAAILSTELEEKYGRGFVAKLLSRIHNSESLPCWAGPISSASGAHLVCVKEISWGVYTPLEEIKSQLINDWRFSVAIDN